MISKLKRLRFSVLDYLYLNKPKLLCLVLITFINNLQFNLGVMFVLVFAHARKQKLLVAARDNGNLKR
jgi:hypothetical protein